MSDDREWRMVRLDDETVRGLGHESSIVRACSESAIREAFAAALPAGDAEARLMQVVDSLECHVKANERAGRETGQFVLDALRVARGEVVDE